MSRLNTVAVVALTLLVTQSVTAEFCNGSPDPHAKPNLLPVINTEPVLLQTVPNGALYMAAAGTTEEIPLVHLWGTAYERGFAQGTLMKRNMTIFSSEVWQYLEDQVAAALNGSSIGPLFNNATLMWLAEVGLEVGTSPVTPLTSHDNSRFLRV